MTREEIREGIREVIEYHFGLRLADKTIDDIFIKMASQGVVIKVDCPECGGDGRTDKHLDRCFSNRCYKCNGYGYKAVESLVGGM